MSLMNIKLTLEPNENGKYIYHPGHVLKGTTIFTLLRTKKFRGIYIKVYGRARTHWIKQQEKFSRQGRYVESQVYESLEVYIDTNIFLVGPKDGKTFELQTGTHKYNFSYQLTENLPSSVNFKNGNISYFIEVMPDIPWIFDQQSTMKFAVARCDDLNLNRLLKEPVKIIDTKMFASPNTENEFNPLRVTVMLPHSGYAANQIVSMTVLYENDSDINVLRTTVTFNQKIEFRSSTIPELKFEEYKCAEIHEEGIDAKKSKSIPISFKIPNVSSSNRRFCKIITISYFIEVVGDLGREHAAIKYKIPITIGDIPIRSEEDNLSVEPSASEPFMEALSEINSELMLVLPSAPPLKMLENDLPPSYDEAMKMIQN